VKDVLEHVESAGRLCEFEVDAIEVTLPGECVSDLLRHVEGAVEHREPRPLLLGQPERHPQCPLVRRPVQPPFRSDLVPIFALVLRGNRPSGGRVAAAGTGEQGMT